MDVTLLEPGTDAAEVTLRALVALEQRRWTQDEPLDPAPRAQETLAWLTQTWGGSTRETVVGHAEGVPIGMAVSTIFETDNTHAVELTVVVDADRRRQGYGSQLLEHACRRTRESGRRVVLAETTRSGPGAAFAAARGFTPGLRMPRRRLHLASLDPGRIESDLADAWKSARGYELVEVSGALPDELMGGLLGLMAAMNDSPTGELDIEDQVYDAHRWRQREQGRAARGQSVHLLFARHTSSGELVGMTEVIDRHQDGAGYQGDTVVVGSHRGRRLGMVMKLEMARRLPGLAPNIEYLDTWNAASNTHMLAINEAMGFQVVDESVEWQREA